MERVLNHLRWHWRRLWRLRPRKGNLRYPRVTLFQARARLAARRSNDEFALSRSTSIDDLLLLLRVAKGRMQVVELGTATGWTASCLALSGRKRQVRTFDPFDESNRRRYLRLAGRAQARITIVERRGDEPDHQPVEFLFIDSSHEREDTISEFRAWLPLLVDGAVVAFHDYGNPCGVADAVRDLGISGHVERGIFFYRHSLGS